MFKSTIKTSIGLERYVQQSVCTILKTITHISIPLQLYQFQYYNAYQIGKWGFAVVVVEWLAGDTVKGLTKALDSDVIGCQCQAKISMTTAWNIKHTPTNTIK